MADGSPVAVIHFPSRLLIDIDHEIHLSAGAGPPIAEGAVAAAIVDPGSKVLTDQTFQREPVNLLRPVERASRPER